MRAFSRRGPRPLRLVLGLVLAVPTLARAEAPPTDRELARLDAALLDHGNPMKVRLEAAMELGRAGGSNAVPALVEALGDPEFPVRGAATLALGNVGDARAAEGLLRRLRDPEAFVRSEAGEALVHLVQRGYGHAVVEQARGLDASTRAQVVALAGTLPPAQSEEAVALGVADADANVRAAASAAITRWPAPEVERFVLAGLQSPSAPLRAGAARIAGEREVGAAVPRLIDVLGAGQEAPEVVEAARAGLRALARRVDAETQRKLAQYGTPEERVQALAVLASIRDPQAFDLLLAVLDDPEPSLRAAAALDLGVLGDKRAAPKLATMVGQPENASIRASLEAAHRRLGPEAQRDREPARKSDASSTGQP